MTLKNKLLSPWWCKECRKDFILPNYGYMTIRMCHKSLHASTIQERQAALRRRAERERRG